MTTPPTEKEFVDTLLERAGLSLDAEEYALYLRICPLLREQSNSLRVPETRDLEPADIYSAT